MSDEGSLNGGGILTPVDWSYPIPSFNSKDFLHQESYYNEEDEDDDIDSYYMDLPPIDMTERLKEVNRALAEDSTPIESNRVTKLRFKEVIAEFQSPRESDSDDGYGDSSEIMYDAEDENDIIYHSTQTPTAEGGSTSTQSLELQEETKELADFEKLEGLVDKPSDLSSTQLSSSPSSDSGNKVVIKTSQKEPHADSDEEIAEEVPEEVGEKAELQPNFTRTVISEGSQGSEEGLRLSETDDQRPSHSYDEDDDVFEDDSEIDEEIESESKEKSESFPSVADTGQDAVTEHSTASVDSSDREYLGSKVKHKAEDASNDISTFSVSDEAKSSCETDGSNEVVLKSKLGSNEQKPGRLKVTVEYNKENQSLKDNQMAKPSKIKSSKNDKSFHTSSPSIPSIKQSLSPYELSTSTLRESRSRKNFSNSLNPSELKQNRSRLNALNSSLTKSPLEAPVQYTRSSRDIKGRKGSPDPRRGLRLQDRKPVRAVHTHSASNLNPSPNRLESSKNMRKPNAYNTGVRKAASTSDLSRSSIEEQSKLNKDVYCKWLQQKNRQAAITKKQMEEAKAAEVAEADAKLQERKKLAEDAFQQWLRRKTDQLRMEKRMKHHQRKLDHQANYARTRTQCEEAYREWWKRKNEEMSARRVSGSTSVRSRSLERTWIQEKTRKLYNTYLTKH